ncbi:hypothetical protein CARUB_v10018001mg [Capsella rubella]|uniref:Uncharacterized protein n=1 Tax=Capsella rubella TaxID=81985 RepID=R0H609_9BRAS|nr:hypothetical protein CARUB_v10018001mg [Capsella rubella]
MRSGNLFLELLHTTVKPFLYESMFLREVNGYLVSTTHVLENVDVLETVTYNILYLFSHAFFPFLVFFLSYSMTLWQTMIVMQNIQERAYNGGRKSSSMSSSSHFPVTRQNQIYITKKKAEILQHPLLKMEHLVPKLKGHSIEWFCVVSMDRKGIISKVTTVLVVERFCVVSMDRKGIMSKFTTVLAAESIAVDLILGWSSGFSWPKSTDNAQVLEC